MALIHLDAGVLIGFLDGSDPHHLAARTLLEQARDAGDALAMAASAVAETLVAPARRGGQAVQRVLDLLAQVPIEVVPIDAEIALGAARLRARHRVLRLPDALVIASASAHAARELVTTDRRWPPAGDLGFAGTIRAL